MGSRNGEKNRLLRAGALGVVFLTAAVLWGCTEVSTLPAGYPKAISPQQVKTETANGALLLDIRELDEYTQSHIAGSLWIPLGELSSHLQELPRGRLIIVVCRSGARSAQGRDILLASGFGKVTSLSGGIQTWIAAGFPVESGPPSNP
jgi:rhodanese-related sulfurtransferase